MLAYATAHAALVFDTRIHTEDDRDGDAPELRPLGDRVLYFEKRGGQQAQCAAVFTGGVVEARIDSHGVITASLEESLLATRERTPDAAMRAASRPSATASPRASIPHAEACALLQRGKLASIASRDATVMVYTEPYRPYCGDRLLALNDEEASLPEIRCSALSCAGTQCDIAYCPNGQDCESGPAWYYFTFAQEQKSRRWKLSGYARYGGS
jgi:hypothetical protein